MGEFEHAVGRRPAIDERAPGANLADEIHQNEFARAAADLEAALSVPFIVEGRERRYRFPRQKAHYLAACLRQLNELAEPTDDQALRDKLATLPGVGLKTASWVVRNHRSSDSVAVVDVHIRRAGKLLGLFDGNMDPSRHYLQMERQFLDFASAIRSRASLLDGLMWDQMRWYSASFAGIARA